MKLSDIETVQELAADRNRLRCTLQALEDGARPGRLEIAVDGKFQRSYRVEAIRPVLIQQVRLEVAEIDRKLIELGVEL